MKSLISASTVALVISLLVISGCTLETPSSTNQTLALGKDLLINEVFTISPDKYYAFSWIEVYNPTSRTIKWYDETKPAAGFAVGSGGAIVHTSDDGGAWSDSLSSTQDRNLNAISMANADTGFAVGDAGSILKVTKNSVQGLNGGVPENLHGVAAAQDQQNRTVFAVGDNGRILRTVNRGLAWVSPQVTPTTMNLRSVYFASFSAIYAAGDSGTIIKSSNAGTAWSKRIVPEPYRGLNFYSINFSGDTGWVTGENGTILSSGNAGGQWLAETSHVGATLRGGFFPPGQSPYRRRSGWVVGDSGVILSTLDYGTTWTRGNSGTTARLNSVTFVDSSRGWVFGDGGVILVTTNGGRTWHPQASHTNADLHGSAFIPLIVRVLDQYVLQMVAQRRAFFYDPRLPPGPGNPNYDYFTKIDSGTMVFNPQILLQFGLPAPADIAPGGFAVITSDSDKFKDHTNLGPGDGTVIPNSIGYYLDPTSILGARPVLWTLLPAGEIRLVKYFYTQVIATGQYLGYDSTIVDVVRYGNYRPTPDAYPNNQPAGMIPEWWSLARYSDDYGDLPSRENTSTSFYMTKDPIPRWASQLSHKYNP